MKEIMVGTVVVFRLRQALGLALTLAALGAAAHAGPPPGLHFDHEFAAGPDDQTTTAFARLADATFAVALTPTNASGGTIRFLTEGGAPAGSPYNAGCRITSLTPGNHGELAATCAQDVLHILWAQGATATTVQLSGDLQAPLFTSSGGWVVAAPVSYAENPAPGLIYFLDSAGRVVSKFAPRLRVLHTPVELRSGRVVAFGATDSGGFQSTFTGEAYVFDARGKLVSTKPFSIPVAQYSPGHHVSAAKVLADGRILARIDDSNGYWTNDALFSADGEAVDVSKIEMFSDGGGVFPLRGGRFARLRSQELRIYAPDFTLLETATLPEYPRELTELDGRNGYLLQTRVDAYGAAGLLWLDDCLRVLRQGWTSGTQDWGLSVPAIALSGARAAIADRNTLSLVSLADMPLADFHPQGVWRTTLHDGTLAVIEGSTITVYGKDRAELWHHVSTDAIDGDPIEIPGGGLLLYGVNHLLTYLSPEGAVIKTLQGPVAMNRPLVLAGGNLIFAVRDDAIVTKKKKHFEIGHVFLWNQFESAPKEVFTGKYPHVFADASCGASLCGSFDTPRLLADGTVLISYYLETTGVDMKFLKPDGTVAGKYSNPSFTGPLAPVWTGGASSVVLHDGMEVLFLDGKGKIVSRFKLEEMVDRIQELPSGHVVVIDSSGMLHSFGTDGKLVSEVRVGDGKPGTNYFKSSPILETEAGTVVLGAYYYPELEGANRLEKIDLAAARVLWSVPIAGDPTEGPLSLGGGVAVVSLFRAPTTLHFFNTQDGSALGDLYTETSQLYGAPTVSVLGGTAIYGSRWQHYLSF
jgi:hypothetical protein